MKCADSGAGDRPSLFGMTPEDLVSHLAARGCTLRLDHARRALGRIISNGLDDFECKRPIGPRAAAMIEAHTSRARLELVERVEDPSDKFVKYLFRSPDGALSEAVRIPLEKPGRFTVCLSSQVGCAMQCVFCATGRLGLQRNLAAWEIVSAFMTVRDEARSLGRVTGAVFMGQGEPFHNYDQVIQAARVLQHPCGGRISGRAITISTVGLVPQIRRFTKENHPYKLIVSLTSSLPERRRELLPVAGRFAMDDLADAITEYAKIAHDRITVAWVLLGGVNTGRDEVDALQKLLGHLPLRVNIIEVNDARENGFTRPTDAERKALMDNLQVLGVPIVRRYSGGAARHAACGMLAATHFAGDAIG